MTPTRRGLLAGLAAALAAPAIVRASSLMNVSVLPADYLAPWCPVTAGKLVYRVVVRGVDRAGLPCEREMIIGDGRPLEELRAVTAVIFAA